MYYRLRLHQREDYTMSRSYRINEVFRSLQGEGVRAGTVNVFVRFTGCNMKCEMAENELSPGGFDCDTEFASGTTRTADELIQWVLSTASGTKWVIFTGGEPGLQLDRELVKGFHDAGFKCAIETNGSIDVSELGLDWVCVSPKVAEHAVRQKTADEVKYVRGYGQGIPKPTCEATHKLISPAFNGLTIDTNATKWCMRLLEENPDWRLSVQLHKGWNIR